MESLLGRLAIDHELVLLSDHAAEWIAYIRTIHPFLRLFKAQFFSFELKQTKREPSTFHTVLEAIHREPQTACSLTTASPTSGLRKGRAYGAFASSMPGN